MIKRRMLFLSPTLPFPPVGGERIWAFNILKYLSSKWEIDLCTFVEGQKEEDAARKYKIEFVNVYPITLPKSQSYLNCLKMFFDKRPLQAHYYFSKPMRDLIRKKINSANYDLILCHLVRMAQYVEDYQKNKKVLYLADALSLRYGLSSRFRKGPFRMIEWLESKKLESYEPEAAKKFDLSFMSSSVDIEYLQKKTGLRNLELLENGVGPEDLQERTVRVDGKKIVFFGNMRTFHNVDALRYFYKEIFPLIRKRDGEVKFVIVGANVPKCILKMKADDSVRIFNDVPDIRPFIKDACLSVVPMRIAAGIQNKILQSMALGVPVVTTPIGLGGIQAEPNRDILVADGPNDFADKALILINDRSSRNSISESAYGLIKEKYLWPNILEAFNDRLTKLL